MVHFHTREKLLDAIQQTIRERLPNDFSQPLQRLIERLYHRIDLREFTDRSLDDWYGFTLGTWRFVQQRDEGEIKTRLFNPNFEQHGWVSSRSIIAVLSRDMPFLRDTVRLVLNRSGIAVHLVSSALFACSRLATGELDDLDSRDQASDGWCDEALVYFEVARISDPQQMRDVLAAIESALDNLQHAVTDFPVMRELVGSLAAQVTTAEQSAVRDDCIENQAFLQWLLEENFTFLGAEVFSVKQLKSGPKVTRCDEECLGLLKCRGSFGAEDLLRELTGDLLDPELARQQLTFSKSTLRSPVHRDVYPQYIGIKVFDGKGRVAKQVRILGMFTSPVYTEATRLIPIVRQKTAEIMRRSGFRVGSHDAKELGRLIEVHPRDELFQSNQEQLCQVLSAIHQLQERRTTRVIVRRGMYGRFASVLVFTPRDLYHTELRIKIQDMLCQALGAVESEFTTFFSESILTRTHFFLRLDPEQRRECDLEVLEKEIIDATMTWEDDLAQTLRDELGEERANAWLGLYQNAFSPGYRADFSSRIALGDIHRISGLTDDNALALSVYRTLADDQQRLHLRMVRRKFALPLSDVIPVLENLGMRVIGENPYEIKRRDGLTAWIHDFSLYHAEHANLDIAAIGDNLQAAVEAVWFGQTESDSFNRLVIGADLTWRQVALLRAFARYLKQIKFNFSDAYIAEALSRYPKISASLVEWFELRFNPELTCSEAQRDKRQEKVRDTILMALDGVDNLNDDRIFRLYMDLIAATLRTNYFQVDGDGAHKPCFAFKLRPSAIPNVPKPHPMFEIFVYSPRVEGVHLRGGKVARGGLRWSDRGEDYRTEILGLVKAQQVKNAVIVPVGAKGGFYCRQMPGNVDASERLKEGVACYQLFIGSLLDVTDNLIEGEICPPLAVRCYDEVDPYLVVAADKGTATFSDIANQIALDRGFWLGDAFASGGSQGFDHKKMGITARGAWVSVQQHFLHLGVDVQQQDFSVVGIGDMSGDVFGNGMLLSPHIRLMAAFNHLHIFIDPNPDAAVSFGERQRLFAMPRSGWNDYDHALISAGGGVFSRSAKSVTISPEMQAAFAIEETRLTPTELISRLLQAPVDLLWNGGIGTYVKASSETHADVGDKANDGLRVDACDLRCRVIGEGGNLGMTQSARIEYALQGGACNTDFIDNSAGVDCSDHEVNVKILLNQLVAAGDLTMKQRNELLSGMIEPVAALVLRNNHRQARTLDIAQAQSAERTGEYQRLIASLEAVDRLDRGLEYLPLDDALNERRVAGKGLVRPELAVLMAYVKGQLKDQLVDVDLAKSPLMRPLLERAFPLAVRERFYDAIGEHRLREQIVATQLANDLVNTMGITFVDRMHQSTRADSLQIAKAFVVSREVFSVDAIWQEIENGSGDIPATSQVVLLQDLIRLLRRTSRWFLRNRRGHLDMTSEISFFTPRVQKIVAAQPQIIFGEALLRWQQRFDELKEMAVGDGLAQYFAGMANLYSCLGIIEAAAESNTDEVVVAEAFFDIGNRLGLDWLASALRAIPVENHWQALAREAFMDDLDWQHRSLTVTAANCLRTDATTTECVDQWFDENEARVQHWLAVLSELKTAKSADFAMYAVVTRELFDLAQSCLHCSVDA